MARVRVLVGVEFGLEYRFTAKCPVIDPPQATRPVATRRSPIPFNRLFLPPFPSATLLPTLQLILPVCAPLLTLTHHHHAAIAAAARSATRPPTFHNVPPAPPPQPAPSTLTTFAPPLNRFRQPPLLPLLHHTATISLKPVDHLGSTFFVFDRHLHPIRLEPNAAAAAPLSARPSSASIGRARCSLLPPL